MFIEFDKVGKIKDPSIVLCNPNGNELQTIDSTIINTQFTLRFNAMSEMTFTVPKKVDGINVPWYDLIVAKRLVKVENIGVFSIKDVVKTGDGLQEIKEVTAFSLEVDLNYKKLNLLSGIYKFFNGLNPTDESTLVGKLMSMTNMRAWSIGYVSPSLWDKTRSYEVSDQTIYNFLMTTVEETLECVVIYDTFNKTINFYDVEEAVTDTDIYLSYDNLIREMTVEEMSDELVTALHCYGGGELDIRAVNPLGDVVIYNFDHFIKENEEWLTDALKTKITAWQKLQKNVQTQFANLLTEYRNKNSELIVLQGELASEQTKYNNLELQLKSAFEAKESTETYAIQMEQQQAVINNKQSQVTSKQNEIELIQDKIDEINNQTKMSNNFTQTEIKELANYIVESTYVNDAFIKTSTMTAVEIQDMAQELYDMCVKVLGKLSQPRYSFTLNGVNFMFLKEFIAFSRQLKLGCSLNVDMDDGLISYPVLLELAFALDDPTDFEMTFANRLRLDKTDFRFAELFGDSINAGSTISIQQGNWSEFNKNYQSSVDTFMKNELDASAKNIINAKNQEIKLGAFGILGQKMLENGSYSPKKFGMINNQLVFTKDNFRTVSGMFGETTSGAYGLLADILVGNLFLGKEMQLIGKNSSGTDVLFSFDAENGVYMKNANIIMDSGETLEDTLAGIENTVSGELAEAIEEISNAMITTYYQTTEPTTGKKGDIWFNNSNGLAYRYNGMAWESIQDKAVIDALDKAQSAQTTADGKIRSFYQNNAPVMTQGKDVGDLWIDTDDNNKLYRWDGYEWVDIRDKTIDAVSTNLANAIGEINDSLLDLENRVKEGEITIWYQSTEPLDAKAGDIWYDTGNKNKAYLAKKGGEAKLVGDTLLVGTFNVDKSIYWVSLQDETVIEALDKAQSAQTTADGKIVSYYQPTMPTNGSQGDLWFDTDDGNKPYRHDGTTFVEIQDKAITKDNLIYNSLPNKGDTKCWSFGNGVRNEFHESIGNFFVLAYPTSGEVSLTSKRYLCQPNTTYTLSFDFSGSGYTENGSAMFYVLESDTITDTKQIGGAFDGVSIGQFIIGGNGDDNWERKSYTFKTGVNAVSFYVRFDANGDRVSPNKGDDYWIRKIKLEANTTATAYTKSSGEDAYYSALESLNKVNNIITSNGSINTDKMEGFIYGGKNNILLGTGVNRMKMNENGILITKNNGVSWDTAISAYGIVADAIQSGGTIQGCKLICGGSNYGEQLVIDERGDVNGYINGIRTYSLVKRSEGRLGLGLDLDDRNKSKIWIDGGQSAVMSYVTPLKLSTMMTGGGYIEIGSYLTTISNSTVGVVGNLYADGEKDAIIPTQHYGVRTLYCTEADRAYFTTDGLSETTSNECLINIDPIFLETIELNSSYPYIIHLTSYSDAKVWVEKIDDYSFVVKSDKDTKFSYTLKAIRVSFGKKYLEEKTELVSKQRLKELQEIAIQRMSEGE